MSDLIKNHYRDDELKKTRAEHEMGLVQKLALPMEGLNCVGVVLERSGSPENSKYYLYKYFPFTLLSDNKEENGETRWGVNKVEKVGLNEVFKWIPNPR